ncbi:unnamed protein product [Tuber aestivum]|uniref:Uncharacterized protein n=1 Tax=Tuber aestivum TaxID=59557 RepID=A0A292PUQ0_9PEZI|nr:unnamed protein product [Tuber aestivum]
MFAKKTTTLGDLQNQFNEEVPDPIGTRGTLNRSVLSPKLDMIQPPTPNQIPHQESANHEVMKGDPRYSLREPQYAEELCVGFRTSVLFIESLDLNIEDPRPHRGNQEATDGEKRDNYLP